MRKYMPMLFVLMLLLALPALGQELTFAEVISGKAFSLTLKLKDLNNGWRKVTVQPPQDDQSNLLSALLQGGMPPGLVESISTTAYYTKGETVTIGKSIFLVAYSLPRKTFTPEEIERMTDENYRPTPPTPDTPLALSLLNLQTCGHLLNIQAFDLVRETTVVRRQQDINQEVMTRLRQLAIAVQMYVQDNDGKYPPMRNAQELQTSIQDYLGNEKNFLHPETGEPFLHNPKLDRLNEAQVKYPTETVLWYEAMPAPDGTRGVAFADGHARRMSEEAWQQLKRKAEIP